MKGTTTSLGGRAPPGKQRRLLHDLVGALKINVFTFELLQALALAGRQARPPAAITIGLANPSSQGLGRAAEFLGDRSHRRPLGRMLTGVLEHHGTARSRKLGGVLAGSGHRSHPLSEWALR